MTLVQRLREAGSTGLDLSPGDPICIEAADEIERLIAGPSQIESTLKLFRMTVLDPMKIGLRSSPTGTMELIILGVDENNIAQWVVNTFKRNKGFSKDTKIKSIEEITGPFEHGTILWKEGK